MAEAFLEQLSSPPWTEGLWPWQRERQQRILLLARQATQGYTCRPLSQRALSFLLQHCGADASDWVQQCWARLLCSALLVPLAHPLPLMQLLASLSEPELRLLQALYQQGGQLHEGHRAEIGGRLLRQWLLQAAGSQADASLLEWQLQRQGVLEQTAQGFRLSEVGLLLAQSCL